MSYYQKRGNADDVLEQMTALLSRAESEEELLARSLMVGRIYFQEKRFDIASVYLRKVYLETSDMEAKRQAAEWLVEICKAQGRGSEMQEYAVFLAPFATLGESQSTMKSQVTALCRQYELEKQERKAIQAAHHTKSKTFKMLGALLILLLLSLVFLVVNNRRSQRLRKQKENLISRFKKALKSQSQTLRKERQMHQVELQKLSDKIESFRETFELTSQALNKKDVEIERLQNQVDRIAVKKDYADFCKEPVCQYIINLVKDERLKTYFKASDSLHLSLKQDHLVQLSDTVERYSPNFTTSLRRRCSKLDEADLNLCHLMLLKMNEALLSALLQRDYSTIKKRIKKLTVTLGLSDVSLQDFLLDTFLNN